MLQELQEESSEPEAVLPSKDPLLQLVSLQKASGCWMLDANLAAVLGKTSEQVEKAKPQSVGSKLIFNIHFKVLCFKNNHIKKMGNKIVGSTNNYRSVH